MNSENLQKPLRIFDESSDEEENDDYNSYEEESDDDSSDVEKSNDELFDDEEENKTLNLKLSPKVASILERFRKFLDGPDKGTKVRSNFQRFNDVRRIIVHTGTQDDLAKLLENDAFIVKDKYIIGYCANHKPKPIEPGFIKKYLNSLLEFIDFLILERVKVDRLNSEILNLTKLRLELWRRKEGKRKRLQKQKKDHSDFEMLVYVTAEQVQGYENSRQAKHAKSLFSSFEEDPSSKVTRTIYCAMRDHLYSVIHFSTSHRSGVT